MHFNRVILFCTFVLTIIIPLSFLSISEVEAIETEEVVVERNIFEDFYYRLVLKDTRDFYDYVMFGIFIIGMLIVLVLKNTHYYTVRIQKEEPLELLLIEEPNKEESKNDDNSKNNSPKKRTYKKKKKIDNDEN